MFCKNSSLKMTIYDIFMFLLQANMNASNGTSVENFAEKNVSSEKNIDLKATTINMSTLSLKIMNKCCPENQHYIEDDNHRLMCGNVSTVFSAISIGDQGYQFLQKYSCETSYGMYLNNFEELIVNGVGYVTYKKMIFPRSCIEYDTVKERWIIMECSLRKNVDRISVKTNKRSTTTTTSTPRILVGAPTKTKSDGLKRNKEFPIETKDMFTTTEENETSTLELSSVSNDR